MKHLLRFIILSLVISFNATASADDDSEKQKEALLKAIQLPQIAEMARKAGIDPEELKKILKEGKQKKVPAKDMEETLDAGIKAQKEHGPIDNFGAFVQSKLKEGLRGRALAEAIHKEHAARGKGKGKHKDKRKDKEKPAHANKNKNKDKEKNKNKGNK